MPKKSKEYWKSKYEKYFGAYEPSKIERFRIIWNKIKYWECFNKAEALLQESSIPKESDEALSAFGIPTTNEIVMTIFNDCCVKKDKKWKRIRKYILIITPIIISLLSLIISILVIWI